MKILIAILAVTFCTAVLSQNPPVTDSTTTTEHSTTVAPVTTTTELSTSTETSTTTSTEKPTTTSTAPSTTTEKPIPTTSPPPTPTPLPGPDKCSWNVTEGDVTCIRAEMKARFIIDNEGKKSYINLGCNATLLNVDCSSSNVTQTLVLTEDNKYHLTMVFEKESDKFSVKNITFDYVLPDGEHGIATNDKEKIFNVKIGNSYLCRSEANIQLGNVTMQVSDMHIQAFGVKDNDKFGTAEECDADDKVSGIIPIAVGVALAALIIIVLIAYLVGRRRSRQRGYQSV